MNLRRYFFTLLVVLPLSSPLSAQETDEDDKFYLDFAGSAVFPYNPKGQLGHGVKAGAGLTAAFGYAFKEGFSTEIEWGHQKVGIGNPTGNLSQVTIGGFVSGDFTPPFAPPSITIEIDGEIKTQSLMGNFYYRYPKWRVSPYAGFGLGAFFHDGAVTRTVTFEYDVPPGVIGPSDIIIGPGGIPTEVLNTTVAYEDSRFAYQIMVGLSVRVSPLLEFHTGYRFRSSRGGPIDADQIESGIRFRF